MSKYKLGGISLSSSVDSDDLALSVKSVILGLSSIIIMLSSHYGYSVTEVQVQFAAGQFFLAISSIGFIFGLVRKVVVALTD